MSGLLWSVPPIARNTFREAVRQPVFWIIVFVTIGLMWLTANIPLWTIAGAGENERMAKDIGLATVTLCGLLVAVFASSSVISDELEKKTALTVLSKPVTRGQFVLGKYIGIALVVLLACAIVGAILIVFTSWYVIGPREGEYVDHPDANVRHELIQRIRRDRIVAAHTIAQGTVLSYLQVMLLASVSVAISTRAPMVVNVTSCVVLFIVGRMADWMRSLIPGDGAVLKKVWAVAYSILPNLDNTYAQMTLAQGRTVSWEYMGWVTLHAGIYAVGALLLATYLLRRREIA
ncbi:MAG: ABC transporter permease subunit [Planctomycetota bacterium]